MLEVLLEYYVRNVHPQIELVYDDKDEGQGELDAPPATRAQLRVRPTLHEATTQGQDRS